MGSPSQDPSSMKERVSPFPPAEAQAAHAGEEVGSNNVDSEEDGGPWGPKTSEAPDPKIYPSEQMEDRHTRHR
jgi:hypothetical protein